MDKTTAGDLTAMKISLQMASRLPEPVKEPEPPMELNIVSEPMREGCIERKDD